MDEFGEGNDEMLKEIIAHEEKLLAKEYHVDEVAIETPITQEVEFGNLLLCEFESHARK